MEYSSDKFDRIKDEFPKDVLEEGFLTELFVKRNEVAGTKILYIKHLPSSIGHQVYYVFQPHLQLT